MSREMRVILNVTFLLIFSARSTNQVSFSSLFQKSSENNIASDILQHENKYAIDNFLKHKGISYSFELDSISDDARLDTPELITKYGYKAETHFITTDDGYILQLHRISGGRASPPREGKRVCFLMHGLLDSSAGFILTGPKHSLAYQLADNGYDVWLGNARGTAYGTNHTTLKPFGSRKNRQHFWSFSWHEIGYYDLPASIDYVLAKTSQTKLQYIGHSQGSTAFFVMASERPEYNDKIELMHALAPAVFMKNAASPPIRAIIPFLPFIEKMNNLLGIYYFKPSKKFRILSGELLCKDGRVTQKMCESIIFLLMGYKSDQLNSTLIPVIMGHTPSGSSTNQIIHFGQLIQSGHFRRYDHGRFGNLLKYRNFSPPDYDLKNVRAPVVVYYSQNDWMADPNDIHELLRTLPNVVKSYLVPHAQFNHIDFLWGTDAPILLYYEILQTIESGLSY